MIKLFTLLFSILLAVASVGGYVFLDAKIIDGEGRISDGQKEVNKGQPALDQGKAKLAAGKIELAEGKAKYENAHDNLFMVFMDKLFNQGKGFEDGRRQIAEGDKKVTQGEVKINAGEKRLAAGELELSNGKEQLKMAKDVRIACALGAIIFGILSMLLAILWRRSLDRVFK
jgi:lipopolysaccharide export system protein LptA